MKVYVNLDSREFVVSPVLLQRVTTLSFTRRDVVPVEVQFVRGGAVVELAAGASGQMGLKKTFAGDFLANDASFTKTGTGTATVYQFDLNLNTANLDAEFPTDDEESVTLKVEIQWSESGTTSSTLPTAAIVYNDVIRGSEGEALVQIVASGFRLASANGTVWEFSADNGGLLQSVVASEATSAPTGLAMRSANGTAYTLSVANDGGLITT
jgi:hypothetical protein